MEEQAYQEWLQQNEVFLKRFIKENLRVEVDVDESFDYYGRVTGYNSNAHIYVD